MVEEPPAPSEIDLDSSLDDIPSMVDFEIENSESVFSDLSHSECSTISEEGSQSLSG